MPHREPYIGLRPFNENDVELFFGRDKAAVQLRNKILGSTFTLLYAASGVGKTSLLRTRVIPQLEKIKASTFYFDNWTDEDPYNRFLQDLTETYSESKPATKKNSNDLAEIVDAIMRQSKLSRFVLIFDQFEEIFSRGTDKLERFRDQIANVIHLKASVHVVISIREEFLAGVNSFRGYIPDVFSSSFRLERLSEDAAREAVRRPAKLFDTSWDEDLVETLVHDLQAESTTVSSDSVSVPTVGIETPFLQIVCQQLWRAAKERFQNELTVDLYNELGRKEGIIKTYVENVTRKFNRKEKYYASEVLNLLAPPSGVKNYFTLEDLIEQSSLRKNRAMVKNVLDILQRNMVVTSRISSGKEKRYSIFHDAFIRVLRDWIREVLSSYRRRKFIVRTLFGVGVVVGAINLVVFWQLWENLVEHRRFGREMAELSSQVKTKPDDESLKARARSLVNFAAMHYLTKGKGADYDRLESLLKKYKELYLGNTVVESCIARGGSSDEISILKIRVEIPADWKIDRGILSDCLQRHQGKIGDSSGRLRIQTELVPSKEAKTIRILVGKAVIELGKALDPNIVDVFKGNMLPVPMENLKDADEIVTKYYTYRLANDGSAGRPNTQDQFGWRELEIGGERLLLAPRHTAPIWFLHRQPKAAVKEEVLALVLVERLIDARKKELLKPIILSRLRGADPFAFYAALAQQGDLDKLTQVLAHLYKNDRGKLDDTNISEILFSVSKFPRAKPPEVAKAVLRDRANKFREPPRSLRRIQTPGPEALGQAGNQATRSKPDVEAQLARQLEDDGLREEVISRLLRVTDWNLLYPRITIQFPKELQPNIEDSWITTDNDINGIASRTYRTALNAARAQFYRRHGYVPLAQARPKLIPGAFWELRTNPAFGSKTMVSGRLKIPPPQIERHLAGRLRNSLSVALADHPLQYARPWTFAAHIHGLNLAFIQRQLRPRIGSTRRGYSLADVISIYLAYVHELGSSKSAKDRSKNEKTDDRGSPFYWMVSSLVFWENTLAVEQTHDIHIIAKKMAALHTNRQRYEKNRTAYKARIDAYKSRIGDRLSGDETDLIEKKIAQAISHIRLKSYVDASRILREIVTDENRAIIIDLFDLIYPTHVDSFRYQVADVDCGWQHQSQPSDRVLRSRDIQRKAAFNYISRNHPRANLTVGEKREFLFCRFRQLALAKKDAVKQGVTTDALESAFLTLMNTDLSAAWPSQLAYGLFWVLVANPGLQNPKVIRSYASVLPYLAKSVAELHKREAGAEMGRMYQKCRRNKRLLPICVKTMTSLSENLKADVHAQYYAGKYLAFHSIPYFVDDGLKILQQANSAIENSKEFSPVRPGDVMYAKAVGLYKALPRSRLEYIQTCESLLKPLVDRKIRISSFTALKHTYFHMTKCYLIQGDFDKASQVIGDLKKRLGQKPLVDRLQVSYFLHKGDLKGAIDHITESKKVDQNLKANRYLLFVLDAVNIIRSAGRRNLNETPEFKELIERILLGKVREGKRVDSDRYLLLLAHWHYSRIGAVEKAKIAMQRIRSIGETSSPNLSATDIGEQLYSGKLRSWEDLILKAFSRNADFDLLANRVKDASGNVFSPFASLADNSIRIGEVYFYNALKQIGSTNKAEENAEQLLRRSVAEGHPDAMEVLFAKHLLKTGAYKGQNLKR